VGSVEGWGAAKSFIVGILPEGLSSPRKRGSKVVAQESVEPAFRATC